MSAAAVSVCGSADHAGFVEWYGTHSCGLTAAGVPVTAYEVMS